MKPSNFIKILFLIVLFFLIASCEKKKQITSVKPDFTIEVRKLTIEADREYDENKYESATKKYKRILSIADPVKNRIDYVDAIISLGYIYQDLGDYIESEAITTQALPHLKYMKKPRFAWNVYYILGYNYFKTNDTENALLYFRKTLYINSNAWRNWSSLNSIGIVYMKQNNFKKAAYIFNKVTTEGYYGEKFKNNSLNKFDKIEYAIMLNNLGLCYFKQEDPRALYYYKKALQLRLDTKDEPYLSNSYTSLSEYYLKSNPKLAKKYAELGYKKASENNFYEDKNYCLSFLVQSSEGNDLRKYTNLYMHFTDSINNVRLKKKNQFSNIKYLSKKDKAENLYLKTLRTENELQLERQKNRSYISYVIISISLFILLFLVFYITSNGKREKNETVFRSEMRISEKLHNELTSDLRQTLIFADHNNLHDEKNKEELLQFLSNIYIKTRNISKENSKIPTDHRYSSVLKEMISEYMTLDVNIILNGFDLIPWNSIEKNKKIILYRVLQELLFNMKKHNNSNMVSIILKLKDKKLNVLYVENSSEFASDQSILEKRLQNVENRIKTIKGTINFDTSLEKAFKINFTFPI
jgi:tetratricopeptide (TPR) repeat protein